MKTEQINISSGQILVIVPHQDDEALMCAGILRNAVKADLHPVVVMVTNGDYGSCDGEEGRTRLRETLNSMKGLGIGENQMEFLGYGDTGMSREESFLYQMYCENDPQKIFSSHCSRETYGLEEKETFHKKTWGTEAVYTKNNLKKDLEMVIRTYHPDKVFTTSVADAHGDHEGLYLFVRDILREFKSRGEKVPALYSSIVHSIAGDDFWPSRQQGGFYERPDGFEKNAPFLWDDRIRFEVPHEMRGEAEYNLKYQTIASYPTALKPDASDFLFSFVKEEEIFWNIKID